MMTRLMRWLCFAGILFFLIAPPSGAVTPKPGDVIDATNADQYADYFTTFMVGFIKNGNGLVEPSTIYVADLKTPLAPESFRKASKKNIGKVTLDPETLNVGNFDYAGYPFPEVKEPHREQKIILNYYYRWRSDDYYWDNKQLCMSAQKRKGGRITHSMSNSAQVCFVGRTAPGFEPTLDNPNKLLWAQMNRFLQPQYKNLRTLQWRYLELERDDDLWSYVPTLRRTLRMMSSEKSNPMNGTPLTYDDFYGFDGKLSQFSYRLINEKKMIGGINFDVDLFNEKYPDGYYDHPVLHGPDLPYGVADAYVIEITPKDDKYPESKKIIYMNQLNYQNMYSETYDKRGELWKGLNMNVCARKTVAGEDAYQNAQCVTDFKTGHYIQIQTFNSIMDSGLPPDLFTPGTFHIWE